MRIGIITFHFVANQGAVLQCCALQKFLEKKGHTVSIIDYRPLYHTVRYSNFRNPFRYAKWFWKRTSGRAYLIRLYGVALAFTRAFYSNIRQPDRQVNAAFDRFIRNNLHLTKRYQSLKQLQLDPPDVDAYISGSDQLWNPQLLDQEFDKAYFLQFGNKDVLRIAYAVSMGRVQEEKYLKQLCEYCSTFTAISIREYDKKTVAAIGRDVHICIDPALLLDAQDYTDMENPNMETTPYIFVYGFENTSEIHKAVAFAKEKYQCRLINGSPHRINLEGAVKWRNYGPDMFLTLIKNAQCIVTNSFHGTVFSVIYKKDFITVIHSTRGGRMTSLLYHLGLRKRLWGNAEFDFSSSIDYADVEKRRDVLRRFSTEYLFEALEGKLGEIIPHMPDEYVIPTINWSKWRESTRYRNIEQSQNEKALPELYVDKANCCGCSSCYTVCPVKAISMEPDVEGFLYPTVDAKKCIRCYACLSVCSFKADQKAKGYIDQEDGC